MSQFPRQLRIGEYTLLHYRIGNPLPRPIRRTAHTRLVQEHDGATVELALPSMELCLAPFEATNVHLCVVVDDRFREGTIVVDAAFECEGRRRPSSTAALDRLQIAGRRPVPYAGDPRPCPTLEEERLLALYIAAMEYGDLGLVLDRWEELDERSSRSLECRCKHDALAIARAVEERASAVAGTPRTKTGSQLASRYAADRPTFTTGYARRDLPFLLGWHLRPHNAVAPLIRARGLEFRSETEWMRRFGGGRSSGANADGSRDERTSLARRHTVSRARPALVRALGRHFEALFDTYAYSAPPPPDGAGDADGFARWFYAQLGDEDVIERIRWDLGLRALVESRNERPEGSALSSTSRADIDELQALLGEVQKRRGPLATEEPRLKAALVVASLAALDIELDFRRRTALRGLLAGAIEASHRDAGRAARPDLARDAGRESRAVDDVLARCLTVDEWERYLAHARRTGREAPESEIGRSPAP
jgi:hypothetical protein